jgi:hypothetical protein
MGDVTLRVDIHGQMPDSKVAHEALGDSAVATIHGYGDHLEVGAAQGVLQIVEDWQFGPAGRAPCGPEIQQDDFAPEAGKAIGRAVEPTHRKIADISGRPDDSELLPLGFEARRPVRRQGCCRRQSACKSCGARQMPQDGAAGDLKFGQSRCLLMHVLLLPGNGCRYERM